MRAFAIAVLAVLIAGSALADEKAVELKNATGRDKVEAHCGACHSLDYIVMNSPFLDAAGWDAEVAKMINAFGAPIDQADARIIADYLKANYGVDRQASAEPPGATRQPPSSQTTARAGSPHRKNVRHKSPMERKTASGRSPRQVKRLATNVRSPQSRPGLFQWLKMQMARPTGGGSASVYAGGYECWQDEGYG